MSASARPLPASHPLYAPPNALITPHMASAGHAARGAMAIRAAQNVLCVSWAERRTARQRCQS